MEKRKVGIMLLVLIKEMSKVGYIQQTETLQGYKLGLGIWTLHNAECAIMMTGGEDIEVSTLITTRTERGAQRTRRARLANRGKENGHEPRYLRKSVDSSICL